MGSKDHEWYSLYFAVGIRHHRGKAVVLQCMDLYSHHPPVLPSSYKLGMHDNSIVAIFQVKLYQRFQPCGKIRSVCDHLPWINTQVFVVKKGHPLKGQITVVIDVLCSQGMPSGLKLVVQSIHFDPSSLYKKVTLDYDNVVEQRFSSNTFAVCLC